MKRYIFSILLICMLGLSSCVVYPQTDDMYQPRTVTTVTVTPDVIIQYGTPYFYDNLLTYYVYRGWYYYPYYLNGQYYFRRYSKPLPPPRNYKSFNHGKPGYDFRTNGNRYRGTVKAPTIRRQPQTRTRTTKRR